MGSNGDVHMKLYHYACWNGLAIWNERVLKPSRFYGRYTDQSRMWPKLVFLTKNDFWEPSIQAVTAEGDWAKGQSDPLEYVKQGIPCWRFQVEVKEPLVKLHYSHPLWETMLNDAKDLGAQLHNWHWTTRECQIEEAIKYETTRTSVLVRRSM